MLRRMCHVIVWEEVKRGAHLGKLPHTTDRVQVGLPQRPHRQHSHQQRQDNGRQRLVDAHVQQRGHDRGAEGGGEDQAPHPPVRADVPAGAPRGEAPRLLDILLLPARMQISLKAAGMSQHGCRGLRREPGPH